MKQLSSQQQIVMAVGDFMMVVGVGCFVFGVLQQVFSVVFFLGAVAFASIQMIQASSDGSENITLRRLKRIMMIGDICFIVAGLLMLENAYVVLYRYLPLDVWLRYCWNNWVIALLVAAILEIYTSHRISYELKKNNE